MSLSLIRGIFYIPSFFTHFACFLLAHALQCCLSRQDWWPGILHDEERMELKEKNLTRCSECVPSHIEQAVNFKVLLQHFPGPLWAEVLWKMRITLVSCRWCGCDWRDPDDARPPARMGLDSCSPGAGSQGASPVWRSSCCRACAQPAGLTRRRPGGNRCGWARLGACSQLGTERDILLRQKSWETGFNWRSDQLLNIGKWQWEWKRGRERTSDNEDKNNGFNEDELLRLFKVSINVDYYKLRNR